MPTPDARRYIAVCMACQHWQCDIRPGAVSDLGGSHPALMAVAQAHVGHLADCVGADGRIKVGDQWVERPSLSDGKTADGVMEMHPFPPWWVVR